MENIVAVRDGLMTSGQPYAGSLLERGTSRSLTARRQVFRPRKPIGPVQRIQKRIIFGGYLLNSYGHFLLESLSRLWWAKRHPDIPILWCRHKERYTAIQAQILQLIEVRNPPFFLKSPTHFSQMDVPSPGYIIPHWLYREHADALAAWPFAKPQTSKRVWLSRAALDGRGGFDNERELEDILRDRGWQIFDPAGKDIRDQLKTLGDAEHIAGIAGSAFHTLIFTRKFLGQITILPRPTNNLNSNFITIAAVKGWSQRILHATYRMPDDQMQAPAAARRAHWRRPRSLARELCGISCARARR